MGSRTQIDRWDNEGGAPSGQHRASNAPDSQRLPRAAATHTTTAELPVVDTAIAAITQATVAITQKYIAQARAIAHDDADIFERAVNTLVEQEDYIAEMTTAIMAIVQPLVIDEDDPDA